MNGAGKGNSCQELRGEGGLLFLLIFAGKEFEERSLRTIWAEKIVL